MEVPSILSTTANMSQEDMQILSNLCLLVFVPLDVVKESKPLALAGHNLRIGMKRETKSIDFARQQILAV